MLEPFVKFLLVGGNTREKLCASVRKPALAVAISVLFRGFSAAQEARLK